MPIGLTVHRGHVAIVIALASGLAAYCRAFTGTYRLQLIMVQVPLLTALWLTGTRAPWLAWLFAIAFLMLSTLLPKKLWLQILELGAVLGISIILSVAISMVSGTNIRTPPTSVTSINGFSSGRIALWQDAIQFAIQRPVRGWGSGGFGSAYGARLISEHSVSPRLALTQAEYHIGDFSVFVMHGNGVIETLPIPTNSAHNVFLDQAVSYGLPGTLLFLALWAMIFRSVWRDSSWRWVGLLLAYWVFLLTWYDAVGYGHLPFVFVGAILGRSQPHQQHVRSEVQV